MTKEKDSTVESNTESRRFQPWLKLRFAIGVTENPNFVLVREELIELVKYWVEQSLNVQIWDLVSAGAGGTEVRTLRFSRLRIDQISFLLPKDDVKAAINEAEAKCKKNCEFSDEDWDIFRNGTWEQHFELREKLGKGGAKKINQT